MKFSRLLSAAAIPLALTACEVTVQNDAGGNQNSNAAAQANPQPQPQPQDPQALARARQIAAMKEQGRRELKDLRLVVDQSERKVRIFSGDKLLRTHDVAVGSEKWPTPNGKFAFHRVDLNPEWIPPKSEEWAEDEERKAPGAPDNPMGRARLVYRMPNTIHGTDDLASLGKAVSHGSIRIANENALRLAQDLLKAGGAWQGDRWFQQMVQNRTKEFQIPLDQDIPLEVKE